MTDFWGRRTAVGGERATSAERSWEKPVTSLSFNLPMGELRTMKESCQGVGPSTLSMVPPSLRAGRRYWGPRAGVDAATLDFSKPLPLRLFLPCLLEPAQALSLPSSMGQLGGYFSMGMRRGRWEWAGPRGCARMPIARVGQSLGECGLDSGRTPDHVSVLVSFLQLPKTVVPVTFLPSGRALVGLGCIFMAGRGGKGSANHGKGAQRPGDLAKGAAFALRGTWWLKSVAFDTRRS